jgi:hypothetical protein
MILRRWRRQIVALKIASAEFLHSLSQKRMVELASNSIPTMRDAD